MKLSAQLLALLFREQGALNLKLTNLENKMATFQEDIIRLTADNASLATAIDAVSAEITAQNVTIADLKAQIAALTAQGVDTTLLEAQLAALEASNARLGALVPPVVPPTPTV